MIANPITLIWNQLLEIRTDSCYGKDDDGICRYCNAFAGFVFAECNGESIRDCDRHCIRYFAFNAIVIAIAVTNLIAMAVAMAKAIATTITVAY